MSLITAVLILLVLAAVVGGGLGYYGMRDKGSIWTGAGGLLLMILIVLFVTGRL
jgi:hypothetical protein